jgi:hypothetical protein
MDEDTQLPSTKRGWTVDQYREDTGLGRSKIYELMGGRMIKYIKVGRRTIITTTPEQLFAKLSAV